SYDPIGIRSTAGDPEPESAAPTDAARSSKRKSSGTSTLERPNQDASVHTSAVVEERASQPQASTARRGKGMTTRNAVILGVGLGVIAAISIIASRSLSNGSGGGVNAPSVSGAPPGSASPASTAGAFSIRLPSDATKPASGTQAPTFILSDFEESAGSWQPDKRLAACRNATISRVRDRAQQGAYWLKMDGLKLDRQSPDAALVVRPDARDLSARGSVIAAAVFVPKEAKA